jgi:hypothetical protein
VSKYAARPIDLARLKTVPLKTRGGKVKAADFAAPYCMGAGIAAVGFAAQIAGSRSLALAAALQK